MERNPRVVMEEPRLPTNACRRPIILRHNEEGQETGHHIFGKNVGEKPIVKRKRANRTGVLMNGDCTTSCNHRRRQGNHVSLAATKESSRRNRRPPSVNHSVPVRKARSL